MLCQIQKTNGTKEVPTRGNDGGAFLLCRGVVLCEECETLGRNPTTGETRDSAAPDAFLVTVAAKFFVKRGDPRFAEMFRFSRIPAMDHWYFQYIGSTVRNAEVLGKSGASARGRTWDRPRIRRMLYQLSYTCGWNFLILPEMTLSRYDWSQWTLALTLRARK